MGMAALEDKIVQRAVGTVLNQIWEEDFLGFSYGFRPGRSQHDALEVLWAAIEHRIKDRRVVRLIQKWLKAGVLEQGKRFLEQLRERPRKFGLELHPAKTRLIEFVRYAAERRNKRGKRKPETFQFLGFTHIGGTNHRTGHFTLHRNTIGKPMAEKLKDIEGKLRRRMHGSIGSTLQ